MLKSSSINASRHKLFGLDVLATYGCHFTDEGIRWLPKHLNQTFVSASVYGQRFEQWQYVHIEVHTTPAFVNV